MNIDNLPETVRRSLLRGYVEKSWRMPHLAEDYPELVAMEVEDSEAYEAGLELRARLDTLFSADSSSELSSAEESYDDVATQINDRYAEGLVVMSGEPGEPGLRGFRTSPFSTMTEIIRNPDGTEQTTVVDLGAVVDDQNQADRFDSGDDVSGRP